MNILDTYTLFVYNKGLEVPVASSRLPSSVPSLPRTIPLLLPERGPAGDLQGQCPPPDGAGFFLFLISTSGKAWKAFCLMIPLPLHLRNKPYFFPESCLRPGTRKRYMSRHSCLQTADYQQGSPFHFLWKYSLSANHFSAHHRRQTARKQLQKALSQKS